jgi:large subunit ribosomal protein L29
MKIKEIKEKNTKELIAEKDKLIKEYKELRFKKVMSVIENPLRIRTVRREVARINTILHNRELDQIKKELIK